MPDLYEIFDLKDEGAAVLSTASPEEAAKKLRDLYAYGTDKTSDTAYMLVFREAPWFVEGWLRFDHWIDQYDPERAGQKIRPATVSVTAPEEHAQGWSPTIRVDIPAKNTMRIVVSKEFDQFVVDPVDLPGMQVVGRGSTMLEALGMFLIGYQKRFGLVIEVDPSAQEAEDQRRANADAAR